METFLGFPGTVSQATLHLDGMRFMHMFARKQASHSEQASSFPDYVMEKKRLSMKETSAADTTLLSSNNYNITNDGYDRLFLQLFIGSRFGNERS